MKLNQMKTSTHRPTSEEMYKYYESITNDWTEVEDLMNDYWMDRYSEEISTGLRRPNPPTKEMIKRAQFVDKTYVWKQK